MSLSSCAVVVVAVGECQVQERNFYYQKGSLCQLFGGDQ